MRPFCSAGLVIYVVLRATTLTAQPAIPYVEAWSIERSQDTLLWRPGPFTITSDCVLWVADRAGLLRYGCNGELVTTADAQGQEYRGVAHLTTLADDTVTLFDPRLRRLVMYSEAGRFLRAIPLPDSITLPGDVRGFGRVADGFVLWTVEKPRGPATVTEHRSYAWIFRELNEHIDTLLTTPAPDWVMARDRINTVAVEAPFGSYPVMLFRKGRLLLANTYSNAVDFYDDVEAEPQRVTLELAQRSVRSVDAEDYEERMRERLFGELERRHLGPEMREYFSDKFNRLLAGVQYPDSTGYFSLLAWGSENELWAQVPCVARRESCTWAILDAGIGSVSRSAVVPHQGHVTHAVVLGEALFTIEVSRGEVSRIAKYVPGN